jgi:hypothetical protein
MHPFMVNTLEILTICRRNAGNSPYKWWSAASKKFRAVYGAWRFINVLTRAGNVSMFSDRCISILSSHLCPSRASGLFPGGCPTWSLRSSSPPHATPVSSLITPLLCEKCRSFCPAFSSFQFHATASHRCKYIPVRYLPASTIDVPAVVWETKFHTHIKQREKLYFFVS